MSEEEIHLDWSAAEVRDGELTVPLSGDTPKGYKKAFAHTVRLLGEHSEWGEVELHKGAVRVAEVSRGAEAKLRHHLEGIVTQVNAKLAADAESAEEPDDDDRAGGQDAEMTESFRSFAAPADAQAD